MSATTADRWIFALRTTIAALLAAYVAFLVNLPQASTSMITVVIVSQPLAGMALSKSLYRVTGTMIGAVVAVALTAGLNDQPEIFALAASAWIGLCVAASTYLRDAPASYGAMLSGYTVAIIAFPNVETPDAVFLAALDRASEILIGIVCATTLSQVFFPKSAADALRDATAAAVASAADWAADTLRGRGEPKAQRDRRLLITRVTKLDGLRIHASFDSAAVRLANRRIRLLHARIVGFLALLVSIHDRLDLLRADRPDHFERLKPLLDAAADTMAKGASPASRDETARRLRAAAPDVDAMRADRAMVLERTILLRVADIVELRDDLDVEAVTTAAESASQSGEPTLARYRDHTLALVSGLAAFAALAVTCAFWIETGWDAGSGALIMVAVMMSLFAQQDDPASSAIVFFVMTAAGTLLAAVYAFAILPHLEGFEELGLALAPFLLVTGYVMAIPRYALAALAFGLGAFTLIGLTNVMTPDFPTFANSAVSTLLGIGVAAVLLRVLRPIGAAWPIARLTAGVRSDLAKAFAGRSAPSRLAFESRMFDRVDGLMTRLDPGDPDQLALEQGALAGVRVGLNGLALRAIVRDLPPAVGAPVAQALAELARHFRRLARGDSSAPPFDKLDTALEAALAADLPPEHGADEAPVWISSLSTSLAQHPRMFGAATRERAA
ncbi:FUSC family protein [Hansschlegelia plantiphila]|uniref:Fusaric acid transporter n=1 Tax=Hansschlegelia plantiphila TaxID=374655 RepID=A0A9W6MW33_9HYPH|nr:FUSC family protein [Hansschlegelia plantiphila]GLK68427.1 fusaric acid transporter [Hansschlegelia plantiphila]